MDNFASLTRKELDGLLGEGYATPEILEAGPFTDEPVVASTDLDLFGIALSGGGIRSATFNLGLLQGLENRGLLKRAHYISSVSGGGYVAGFYSALSAKPKQSGQQSSSPTSQKQTNANDDAAPVNEPETPAVRHLREFSSFLVPRVGLFQAETHRAIAHAIRVMSISIAGSLSLLVCAMCVWLYLVWACAMWPSAAPLVTIVLMATGWCLTSIATGQFRRGRIANPGGAKQPVSSDPLLWHLVLSSALFVVAWFVLQQEWAITPVTSNPRTRGTLEIGEWPTDPPGDSSLVGMLIETASPAMGVLTPYLAPVAFLAIPYVALLLQRAWFGLLSLWGQELDDVSRLRRGSAADQSTALISAAAVLWVFCLVPWKLGVILAAKGQQATMVLLAILLALFEVSRRYAPAAGRRTRAPSSLRLRVLNRLPAVLAAAVLLGTASLVAWGLVELHWRRPLTQPLEPGTSLRFAVESLTYYADVIPAVLLLVVLAGLVVAHKHRRHIWAMAACLVAIIPVAVGSFAGNSLVAPATVAILAYAVTAPPLCLVFAISSVFLACFTVLFTPTRTSFFTFYRERIARAYLGARDASDKENRLFRSRATAEQPDDDIRLKDLDAKPLHLICVAANDLGNDRLSNLSRGASSAVLSKHGLAVGNRWHSVENLGRLTLGDAITASGAAFNSNMGAASVQSGLASGILMTALNLRLGLWIRTDHKSTTADGQGRRRRYGGGLLFFREMFQRTFATHGDKTSPTYHLSDGGHFENLGMYELLRRHCSYILVSDATADPDLTFADIGNALQLAREDFGIEIDIDFSTLRPDENGLSKARLAVGRIYYPSGKLGVLLYVKPVLVGDETEDIRQYQAQSPTFPHEGTADQFYDRAQWECYRKLGALTVRRVFGYVEPGREPDEPSLEWVFQTAYSRWSPMPGGVYKRTIEANEDYSNLIASLGASAVATSTLLGRDLNRKRPDGRILSPSAEDVVDCLSLIQTIEHVWASCQLDDYLFHRAASGWFDFIERAASGPEFRQLWPLLRWQFSREFGEFMQKRFYWLDPGRPESSIQFTSERELSPGTHADVIDRFAREHPRGTLASVKYADGYQLWLRVADGNRIVPDTILAATPGPGVWAKVTYEKKTYRLLDLGSILVRPGTGGLRTAAMLLSQMSSQDDSEKHDDSWALCIRGTPDQHAASEPRQQELLLTQGGRERATVVEIHRRALPFIEAGLGVLRLCRVDDGNLLPNRRSHRTGGELVGIIPMASRWPPTCSTARRPRQQDGVRTAADNLSSDAENCGQ